MEHRRRELAALERVQRRVGAAIFLSIVLHGVVALPIVAGIMLSNGEEGNAVALVIMAGIVGQIAVVVTRIILAHKPFAPLWLAIGCIPLVVSVWYVWFAPFTIH